MTHEELLELAVRLAREAGAAIDAVRRAGFAVERKGDASPVTAADHLSEGIIIEGLRAAAPEIPIIAEEAMAAGGEAPPPPPRFWLVDPLDGTKEFISRNGEFTVNIALIEDGQARLGVVLGLGVGAGLGLLVLLRLLHRLVPPRLLRLLVLEPLPPPLWPPSPRPLEPGEPRFPRTYLPQ